MVETPGISGLPSGEPTLHEDGETSGASGGRADQELLPEGTQIGRYVVRGLLGQGGMGVVYHARDPELDRDVALKLVRARASDASRGGSSDGRRRVLREAQAMAKLSHPNTVTVYDVGVHDEQVFIAMELLAGRTLTRVLANPLPVREILDMFVQAGRGLAAAHAAGIVHRDFKPDNVIVCDDGPRRVCVTDFGLAARSGGGLEPRDPTAPVPLAHDKLETLVGSLAGTPAYMAPEQHLGAATSPQTDQFAFCVALYEALLGERPFAGESIPQLAIAVVEGQRRPLPPGRVVDRRVLQAIVRGLAADPAQRWPSMAALLEVLARDPAVARRRWLLGGAVIVGLGGATALGAMVGREPGCAQAGAAIDELWNGARAQRVHAAFEASGRPGASQVLARATAQLDDYTARLREVAVEACEAHRAGGRSEGLFDAQVRCIARRSAALDRMLALLEGADAALVDRTVAALGELPELAECGDLDALALDVVPPVEHAAAIGAIRGELAEAAALYAAGRWREAATLAGTAHGAAQGLGWAPLVAEAGFEQGRALAATDELKAAETALIDAFWTAAKARHDRVAAWSAVELVHLVGYRAGRLDDAAQWEQQAEAAVARLGDDPVELATLWVNRAVIAQARGDFDAAYALSERAYRLRVELRGEADVSSAAVLQNLGAIRLKQGRFDEGAAQLTRARDGLVVALGEDHPSVARITSNLGAIALQQGHLDQARAHFEAAIAVFEQRESANDLFMALHNLALIQRRTGQLEQARATLERAMGVIERGHGREHTSYAAALSSLAGVESASGDHARALERYREALALRERLLGTEHEELTYPLGGIASTLRLLGRGAEALPYYERQLSLALAKLGPEHPRVALARVNLGDLLLELGQLARGTEEIERAVAMRAKLLPPEHPDHATARTTLARARRLGGRLDEAITEASAAEGALLAHPGEAGTLATARLELAHALAARDRGDDRVRARSLAEQARGELVDVPGAAQALAEAEQLIAQLR